MLPHPMIEASCRAVTTDSQAQFAVGMAQCYQQGYFYGEFIRQALAWQ